MTETNITRSIMLAIGRTLSNVRVFRNNTGMAWQGDTVRKGSLLIIKNPRPLQAGLCEGSSDLIGWTSMEITPEMVGKKVAVFTALEVKSSRGSASDEQRNFIQRVKEAGGIATVVRTEQEAIDALKK